MKTELKTNPLMRASFYVEELKQHAGAAGGGKVTAVPTDTIAQQIEWLLAEGGFEGTLTGEDALRVAVFVGSQMGEYLDIPPGLAISVWLDGMMHGAAMGLGLSRADPPEVSE